MSFGKKKQKTKNKNKNKKSLVLGKLRWAHMPCISQGLKHEDFQLSPELMLKMLLINIISSDPIVLEFIILECSGFKFIDGLSIKKGVG